MFPEGRMLDFVIVGVIALIVVGPKDLPILMRKVGQFVAKMRGMAAEFRASFDELARQSELEELRKEVEAMRTSQQSVLSQFNPMADTHAKTVFDDIGQHMRTPLETPAQTPSDIPPSAPPVMTALPPAEPAPAEPPVAKPARAPRAKTAVKAAAKSAPADAKAKPKTAKPRAKTSATTGDAS
jgi:sec-independent protein translocase protein TatB